MTDDHRLEVGRAVGEAVDAGLSIIWPNEDGSKRPEGSWKDAQDKPRSREELRLSFKEKDRSGLMVVCGKVSGNLEVLDFENADIYAHFQAAMSMAGEEELLERLERGYQERCPRGGYHLPYRSEIVAGNQKLAFDENLETLIETRGEGGCFMAAPTRFNGSAWTRMQGSFTTIATVTIEERDTLHRVARLLSRAPVVVNEIPVYEPKGVTGDRPGDDFNRRGNWNFLLEAGWTIAGTIGDQQYWRRPDKDWERHKGHSAVLHLDTDIFVPFSSSTPFPVTEVGYGKFSAYAILRHDGDFSAAATELRRQGYGREREPVAAELKHEYGQSIRGSQLGQLVIPDVESLPILGVEGLIMKGGSNLLYGFPKAGKTELMAAAINEWIIEGRRVAYFTEESVWFWKARLERYQMDWDFWEPLLLHEAMGWGIVRVLNNFTDDDVLIVDTVRSVAGYRENKVDEDVGRVIEPMILGARERGATLIAGYHARKMPGDDGTDISGHHSLFGAFDRALQLKRIPGQDNERQRRLTAMGRLLDPTKPSGFPYEMKKDGTFRVLDGKDLGEAPGPARKCEGCGNEFTPSRRDKKFCSPLCQRRAHREKSVSHDVDEE